VQEYKESKVEMYKPIWAYCSNVMAVNHNSIRFNSHKNI
jgi:hypothetical protein